MTQNGALPAFSPEFLARFRIGAMLGAGSFGSVFSARQLDLDRDVALKILHQVAPEELSRFRREARLLAAVDCPDFIAIYDSGMDRGIPYLVCELIVAPTLEREIARALPPLWRALIWLANLGRALDVAHRQGITHRDVKPSNVFVLPDGSVKIGDFGLARSAGSTALTEAGAVVGTPAYMAPEALSSEPCGPPVDQYALGIVAFEVVTGRQPFQRPTPYATALARLAEPPPAPTSYRPGLPPELDLILLRMLARQPADRYPTIGDAAAAFEALAEQLKPRPREPSPSVHGPDVAQVAPGPQVAQVTRGPQVAQVAHAAERASGERAATERASAAQGRTGPAALDPGLAPPGSSAGAPPSRTPVTARPSRAPASAAGSRSASSGPLLPRRGLTFVLGVVTALMALTLLNLRRKPDPPARGTPEPSGSAALSAPTTATALAFAIPWCARVQAFQALPTSVPDLPLALVHLPVALGAREVPLGTRKPLYDAVSHLRVLHARERLRGGPGLPVDPAALLGPLWTTDVPLTALAPCRGVGGAYFGAFGIDAGLNPVNTPRGHGLVINPLSDGHAASATAAFLEIELELARDQLAWLRFQAEGREWRFLFGPGDAGGTRRLEIDRQRVYRHRFDPALLAPEGGLELTVLSLDGKLPFGEPPGGDLTVWAAWPDPLWFPVPAGPPPADRDLVGRWAWSTRDGARAGELSLRQAGPGRLDGSMAEHGRPPASDLRGARAGDWLTLERPLSPDQRGRPTRWEAWHGRVGRDARGRATLAGHVATDEGNRRTAEFSAVRTDYGAGPAPEQPPESGRVYEAEAMQVWNMYVERRVPGYTGWGYVVGGFRPGMWLDFTPQARKGRCRLELRYAAARAARRQVVVEGGRSYALALPATGDGRWGTCAIEVDIPGPKASIQITTTEAEGDAGAILLDSVRVLY